MGDPPIHEFGMGGSPIPLAVALRGRRGIAAEVWLEPAKHGSRSGHRSACCVRLLGADDREVLAYEDVVRPADGDDVDVVLAITPTRDCVAADPKRGRAVHGRHAAWEVPPGAGRQDS